jgi:hypothetical protein
MKYERKEEEKVGMRKAVVHTIAEEMDICTDDHQTTDQAVKEIQLGAAFSGIRNIRDHSIPFRIQRQPSCQ